MVATFNTIHELRQPLSVDAHEVEIDRVLQENFLKNISFSQITNIIPFALIGFCSGYLADWKLTAGLLVLQAGAILAMFFCGRLIRKLDAEEVRHRLWRLYEVLAFASGGLWGALMLPVAPTLGRDIGSTFVCVVIIVTVTVTCMVIATRMRIFVAFLIGFELCLLPQTIVFIDAFGPIPLVATIGLVPALIGLTNAVRRQTRMLVQTQLEKQRLADELSRALAASEHLARHDTLTGLFNRRAFEEAAERARRDAGQEPMSLILIDLDHFKSINDTFGHAVGDSVLQATASMIAGSIRRLDLLGRGDGAIARWGGEEFIVMLRNCPIDVAARKAESIREKLLDLRCADWPDGVKVSGSFGVARWSPETPLHLAIAKADDAMYRAKNSGRNRTVVHDGGELPTLPAFA